MVSVAVEGCCHGSLNNIYRALKPDVDLLIICGDFQAIRNTTDLETMNVPPKYKTAGDFPEYYSGKRKAPVPTIFIGGNHECSSYMRELQYGGWVAPNIYYLGEFGSVWIKGIRISGISGIWNPQSFSIRRHFDYSLPYNPSSLRSVYHVKPKNLLKLLLSGESHIVVSHDWPQGIWKFGDERGLLRKKKFFKEDMQSGKLGSPAARAALEKLVPQHWLSSHLHVKFTAHFSRTVTEEVSEASTDDMNNPNGDEQAPSNQDELQLDVDDEETPSGAIELDMDDEAPRETKRRKVTKTTRFLALDKCLPRRAFLDYIEVSQDETHPSFKADGLLLDAYGLAAQQVVENYIRESPESWQALDPKVILDSAYSNVTLVKEFEEAVEKRAAEIQRLGLDLQAPAFERVAPTMDEISRPPLQYWPNPQTEMVSKAFDLPLPSLERC